MSPLILLLNKNNIVTYKNKKNNVDSNSDSGDNSGVNSDGVNEDYSAKMTYIQDKLQIKHVY